MMFAISKFIVLIFIYFVEGVREVTFVKVEQQKLLKKSQLDILKEMQLKTVIQMAK